MKVFSRNLSLAFALGNHQSLSSMTRRGCLFSVIISLLNSDDNGAASGHDAENEKDRTQMKSREDDSALMDHDDHYCKCLFRSEDIVKGKYADLTTMKRRRKGEEDHEKRKLHSLVALLSDANEGR